MHLYLPSDWDETGTIEFYDSESSLVPNEVEASNALILIAECSIWEFKI